MKWENLTPEQHMVLAMTEKLARLDGLAVGMFYAAEMTDNKDAQRLAWDLRGDIKFVLDSILKLADGINGGNDDKSHKLTVAVGALRALSRLGNGNSPGTSEGNVIAQRALMSIGEST